MKPLSPVLLVALLLPVVAPEKDAGAEVASWLPGDAPRFEDYPAATTFMGKPTPPKLGTGEARRFRTVIRMGAREGPNFAGHYTIMTWGCGTSCMSMAIIDAATGRVFLPDIVLSPVAETDMPDGLAYRKNSQMLITTGFETMEGHDRLYYLWKESRLHLIRREHVKTR